LSFLVASDILANYLFSFVFQARMRFPRIDAEVLAPYQQRVANEEDPDPYVGNKHKMGRTHTSRPGNFSAEASGSDDDVTVLEVLHPFAFSYTAFL
jgi:hypothetical protein